MPFSNLSGSGTLSESLDLRRVELLVDPGVSSRPGVLDRGRRLRVDLTELLSSSEGLELPRSNSGLFQNFFKIVTFFPY